MFGSSHPPYALFVFFSGVIFDGEELHYLEKGSTDEGGGGEEEEEEEEKEEEDDDDDDSDNDDDGGEENGITALHFLYRHADLKANQTCGEKVWFISYLFKMFWLAAMNSAIFICGITEFTITY
jgi:hypothetical protein